MANARPAGWFGEGGTLVFVDHVLQIRTGVALNKDGHPLSFNDAIEIMVKGNNPHIIQSVLP